MDERSVDPSAARQAEGFPKQEQDQPGLTELVTPKPDHGEATYRGSDRLVGRRALITGGDSGIGRAVAIAFAREGADVAISYLPEEQEDADETARWVEEAGRKAVLLPGDIRQEEHKLPTFGLDTPLGRAGQPAELAPAYVYLASDDASYVSGAILPVTGGKGL